MNGHFIKSKNISVNGKTVLVTGGTGSLGEVLVKRLLDEGAYVRIFSRDEYKQSEMDRKTNNRKLSFYLGDVRNLERLRFACKDADIIIHAAAFKRMDSTSHNAFEVADVNIQGTNNVVLAADERKVIFISSDKAASGKCIYGASKFIGEGIILAHPKGIVWRLGNLIGSRGSVWGIFEEQKKQGIPFSITSLEATRFVMSIESACDYILSNVGPGLHYPKNLKSMRIIDIANSISLNYPYKIIGLRENESLHEKFYDGYSSDKCLGM